MTQVSRLNKSNIPECVCCNKISVSRLMGLFENKITESELSERERERE